MMTTAIHGTPTPTAIAIAIVLSVTPETYTVELCRFIIST